MQRFLFLLFIIYFCSKALTQPLFLEQEVINSIIIRDSIFAKAKITSKELNPTNESFNYIDTFSTWGLFLKGIYKLKDSPNKANEYFDMAINSVNSDIGTLWLLSIEFERIGFNVLRDKCLKKTEMLFLSRGASSAPLISYTLLYNSYNKYKEKQFNVFNNLKFWVKKFDKEFINIYFIDFWPKNFIDFFSLPKKLYNIFEEIFLYWKNQLIISYYFFIWIYNVFFLVFFTIFLCLLIKYIPKSFHLASERFPVENNSVLKLILCILVILPLCFFSILAFIWLMFFIIWKYLNHQDKKLAMAAIIIFLLFPFGLKIKNMFLTILSPTNSVMLYKKALDEGYYFQLDSCIQTAVSNRPQDYLIHTAAAIYSIKKNDLNSSLYYLNKAQKLAKYNPVVLVSAGNALYFKGELSAARNAYQQCIKYYPSYEPAYYNLGQYFFSTMETAKGMDYISQAARINSKSINSFIKKNDEYFSKDVPLLRQLVFPDFSCSFFWKNVFFKYSLSSQNPNDILGGMFFGINLKWYFFISLFLFLLIIILDFSVWSKERVQKVTYCKVCQRTICRKCKKGSICSNCFKLLQSIRNDQIRERIMAKIINKKQKEHFIFSNILNIIYPGTQKIYLEGKFKGSIVIFLLTSFIYSFYFIIFKQDFFAPYFTIDSLLKPILFIMILYNIFFLIFNSIKIVKKLNKKEE